MLQRLWRWYERNFRFHLRLATVLFLLQWLHLFWITDEVIVGQLSGTIPIAIPRLVAYGAIAIDYLELPVMIDTTKKAFKMFT